MDRDTLAVAKPQAAKVVGVEEDDVAAFDASVDVVVFVDDCVELALTANCHHSDLVGFSACEAGQIVYVQSGAAIGRRELRSVKSSAADLEFLLGAVDFGDLFEAGHDF